MLIYEFTMLSQSKIVKSEDQWKKQLTPAEYKVLREKDTEPPFSGKFYKSRNKGVYVCAACGNEVFSSDTKFDSGSGWPSFWSPYSENNIEEIPDLSLGMERTEIICAKCGSHLGHVFDDGPKKVDMLVKGGDNGNMGLADSGPAAIKTPEPSGKRYCINSLALKIKGKDGMTH